jgi:hypothetical protein
MGNCLGGKQRGKERILMSEEDQSMLYIYIYIIKQCKEIYQTMFERREKKERGNGNIMQEMNLFKGCCMHVWNHHNKIPCIINLSY